MFPLFDRRAVRRVHGQSNRYMAALSFPASLESAANYEFSLEGSRTKWRGLQADAQDWPLTAGIFLNLASSYKPNVVLSVNFESWVVRSGFMRRRATVKKFPGHLRLRMVRRNMVAKRLRQGQAGKQAIGRSRASNFRSMWHFSEFRGIKRAIDSGAYPQARTLDGVRSGRVITR